MKKFLIAIFLCLPILFFNSCATLAGRIAYANFYDLPGGSVDTDGYNINGSGWDINPEDRNGLRLLNKGAFFSLQFYVNDTPENAFLSVEHASSPSSSCSNSGFSPITIKINDVIVVSNFSPPTHFYTTKRWNVTNFLRTGENVISWTASDLCSAYLLRHWTIFDSGQYYYVADYNSWYRNYDYQPGFYIFRQNRYVPNYYQRPYEYRQNWLNNHQRHNEYNQNRYMQNNQQRHNEYKQNRNMQNNQQRRNEHKQKQNGRQNHGKR